MADAGLTGRLRDLLAYVQHKNSCATRQFWAGRVDLIDTSKCTCGLAALIERADPPQTDQEPHDDDQARVDSQRSLPSTGSTAFTGGGDE